MSINWLAKDKHFLMKNGAVRVKFCLKVESELTLIIRLFIFAFFDTVESRLSELLRTGSLLDNQKTQFVFVLAIFCVLFSSVEVFSDGAKLL